MGSMAWTFENLLCFSIYFLMDKYLKQRLAISFQTWGVIHLFNLLLNIFSQWVKQTSLPRETRMQKQSPALRVHCPNEQLYTLVKAGCLYKPRPRPWKYTLLLVPMCPTTHVSLAEPSVKTKTKGLAKLLGGKKKWARYKHVCLPWNYLTYSWGFTSFMERKALWT